MNRFELSFEEKFEHSKHQDKQQIVFLRICYYRLAVLVTWSVWAELSTSKFTRSDAITYNNFEYLTRYERLSHEKGH